jgi:deoxyribodipyrimidine photo-lyase
MDILFYVETQEKQKNILKRIVELCQKWEAKHLCANIEYEVDELLGRPRWFVYVLPRALILLPRMITCVVTPGMLSTGAGKQYAVFTPWFRTWLHFLKENADYLELSEDPNNIPIFSTAKFRPRPAMLTNEEKKRFEELYPTGEHEAMRRLDEFLKKKCSAYHEDRSLLPGQTTSVPSPYFASGALSVRTAVATAKRANKNHLDRMTRAI